jgi:Transposase DDE domain
MRRSSSPPESREDAVDTRQLAPLLLGVEANTGRLPEVATADNGYFNPDTITDERLAGVDLYVATARERKPSPPVGDPAAVPLVTTSASAPITCAAPTTVVQQMRDKLATDLGRATYKLRKCIPEPVFGQIKEARGFRRFSFRGLTKVTAEWFVVALTHNLLKLFRSGWKIAPSDRVVELIRDVVRSA